MINLLLPETKEQIRAAKLNTVLVTYLIILGCAIGFLALVYGGSYYLMSMAQSNAKQTTSENEERAAVYQDTRVAAQQLQTDLASARSMINSDIDYSTILTGLGALVPQGVVLQSLTLNTAMFTTPTEIQAYATTTELGLALRDALQGSSLVSSVTLGAVSSQGGIEGYPVSVKLTVTFKQGAAR